MSALTRQQFSQTDFLNLIHRQLANSNTVFEFERIDFSPSYDYSGSNLSLFEALERRGGLGVDFNNSPNGQKYKFIFKNCFFPVVHLLKTDAVSQIEFIECQIENFCFASAGPSSFKASTLKHKNFTFIDTQIQYFKVRWHEGLQVGFNFLRCTFVKSFDLAVKEFDRPLHFERCSFGLRKGLEKSNISFSNCNFHTISFRYCSFYSAPKFFESRFNENTSFIECKYLDTASVEALGGWRVLTQKMQELGADREAAVFHSLELETYYNAMLPSGLRILISNEGITSICAMLLAQINNFGRNLWLPLFQLFLIGFYFYLIYGLAGSIVCEGTDHIGWVKQVCAADDTYQRVFYSFKNSFGPIGFVINNEKVISETVWSKIFSFAHSLITSVIWFLWILQIRTRFKIH